MAAMVPIKQVENSIINSENYNFSKEAFSEAIMLVRDLAEADSLKITKISNNSSMALPGGYVIFDVGFVAADLLDFANFIDDLVLKSVSHNISLKSFSANLNDFSVKGGRETLVRKAYFIEASFEKGRRKKNSYAMTFAADISLAVKYISNKFEITSIIFSENTPQIAFSGCFSLKGTRKMLIEFLEASKFKSQLNYHISEKGYETRKNHLVVPFLLQIFFNVK